MSNGTETAGASPSKVWLLKVIVVGLAILILVGLAAVAWRVVQLASGRATTPPAARSSVPHADAALAGIELELPVGAEVGALALEGNRLAVHYRSATENGIAIVDLTTGREVSRVRLRSRPSK